jgi:uncharacterized protein
MNLVEYSEAASFLHRTKNFLAANEAKNNLLFSSALALARVSTPRSSRLGFYTVEENGKIVCAALNAVERRMLFSSAEEQEALFLGVELAGRKIKIKGLLGPEPGAGLFCAAYNETTQTSNLQPHLQQGIFQLETLIQKPVANGIMRVAQDKDLRLLLNWTESFVKESELHETPAESEELVRRYVEARQLFIWEDPHPVAMGGFGGVTPNGARVNMVYTEPKARSKGYASSLVQTLSQKLLSSGHKYCFLFADSKNAAANRMYETLGYQRVGDFTDYL